MEDRDYLAKILPKLVEPMPYKWRVQSFSKNKPMATCVAYIDARQVMDRLDEVCIYGWERSHTELKGHIYSGVTIVLPSGRDLTKWDCGVESNTDAEKGEASDSFKRAGVNWGIGRFLYDLEIQYVDASCKKEQGKYPHVIDDKGKRVYDLTEYLNKRLKNNRPEDRPKQEEKRDWLKEIESAKTEDELRRIFGLAYVATDGELKAKIKLTYDIKKQEFKGEEK